VFDEYIDLLAEWMYGIELTNRADEDELRAQVGVEIIKLVEEFTDLQSLWVVAIKSILDLPEGHELRDVEFARQGLLKYFNHAKANEEPDNQIQAIIQLIDYKLEESTEKSLELIQYGQNLLKEISDSNLRGDFLVTVSGYYASLAKRARDEKDVDSQFQWGQEAKKMLDQVVKEQKGRKFSDHQRAYMLYRSARLFEV
jgi:hypothetical protein